LAAESYPVLATVTVWQEDIGLPAEDRSASTYVEREAARSLSPLGPRLRLLLLRYSCGTLDVVVTADASVVDQGTLRYIAGLVTCRRPVSRMWPGGLPDSFVPQTPSPHDVYPVHLRKQVTWGLPDDSGHTGLNAEEFNKGGIPPLTKTSLIGAVAFVLAVYNGSGSSRLRVEGNGGCGSAAHIVVDLDETMTVESFLKWIEQSSQGNEAEQIDDGVDVTVAFAEQQLGVRYRPISCASAPLLVSMECESESVAAATLWYGRDTVHPEQARRFVRQVSAVATQFADADVARTALGRISILSDVEALEIISLGRSSSFEDEAPAAAIHHRFHAAATMYPDRPALSDGRRVLSYSELDCISDAWARGLLAAGIRPTEKVGVCLDRTADLVVTLLAVLKAGATYVPLDPSSPPDRLRYIAVDAGIRVLVGDPTAMKGTEQYVVVAPAALADAAQRRSGDGGLPSTAVEDPAYTIYTSGSTGKPKGVVIPHRNVGALVDAARDFDFTEQDVWTLFHSSAFDFSVWEIWGCLLTGGRLVVVPYLVTRSPGEFRELLAAERVTVLNQTPSAFANLMDSDATAQSELTLRLLIFGGEPLDVKMLEGWFRRHPPSSCRIVNMYGITETTVHVTAANVRPADIGTGTRCVGRALPGWAVTVRDSQGRLLPPGVPGEIYVGGAGVAQCYLRRDELTKARFRIDPVSGERLYRSGDKGRLRLDGALDHLGRLDDQVKIRGFRIELGEIRQVLLDDPGVDAAGVVVAGNADDPGGARIAAYVVLSGDTTTHHVRRRAARLLPDYMVPTTVTSLPFLPLTVNGKLDTSCLPQPRPQENEEARGAIASALAGAQLSHMLLEVWRRVLPVPVSADDDFFDIGGNSLLAVQLSAAVREAGLPPFSIRELYQNRSVAQLAERLAAKSDPGAQRR
jgi:amino acid adenylation domain-containing protein